MTELPTRTWSHRVARVGLYAALAAVPLVAVGILFARAPLDGLVALACVYLAALCLVAAILISLFVPLARDREANRVVLKTLVPIAVDLAVAVGLVLAVLEFVSHLS